MSDATGVLTTGTLAPSSEAIAADKAQDQVRRSGLGNCLLNRAQNLLVLEGGKELKPRYQQDTYAATPSEAIRSISDRGIRRDRPIETPRISPAFNIA